ncbi:MAG: FAD-dependent oxidoreductase, partial [Gemmatimonadota bacterium]|nr:FAD-dependent oxidoreductase [Gemmatimonadota bacterium]
RRAAGDWGLTAIDPDIDGGRVLESVRQVRARIQPHDDPDRFRAMGVDVIEGEARFVSPREIEVDGRRIRARRFVIATGSRPSIPPIEGLEEAGYFTHVEAFDREDLPGSLVVVGGGPIGLELAQSYRRLGVEVTVIEWLDRLLGREEPELADRLADLLEAEGVRIITGHGVRRVERTDAGRRVTYAARSGGGEGALEVDEVLVATGRRPNTEELGLEEAGVATGPNGWVQVDRKLRTSQKHIFGAGDVTGGYLFTHVADHEARAIVQNALFPVRTKIDYDVIPWCTYTDPELARVGLTEAEARERHGDAVSAHGYDLSDLDRAVAERAAVGCVKIVTGRGGAILGGHILGHGAGTMIAEIALAMRTGTKLGALSSLVHPYPTMSEGVRRTADAYRRSLLTGWRKTAVDLALRLGRRFPA